MQKGTNEKARIVVTLLAGFAISMHLAVLLHEVGHAIGSMISGHPVLGIDMFAPFPAGQVVPKVPNSFPHVAGGIIFGTLAALIPLLGAKRLPQQSPLRFVCLLTVAFCLAHNGIYLFAGSLAPFADASDMIGFGVPRVLLFVLGVPLLIGFVRVLSAAIRLVGVPPAISAAKWIAQVELGLLTFPALVVFVGAWKDVAMRPAMLILFFTYAVCFSIAARGVFVAARTADFAEESMPQNWALTGGLMAAAMLLIFVEWLAFRPRF